MIKIVDKKYVTHDDILNLTYEIGDMVGDHYDVIAAVARGGLIPGVYLSHYLNIPLYPIRWSTRDHAQCTTYGDIEEDLQTTDIKILLLDDINDSGKTFAELHNDWNYNPVKSRGLLKCASLFQRHSTIHPSDYYGRLIEDDSWIVFPWERG